MSGRRLVLAALLGVGVLWVCVVVGLLSIALQHFIPAVVQIPNPGDVDLLEGNAFYVAWNNRAEWELISEVRGDDNAHSWQSNLVLLEDGKALGPAHAVHSEIKEKGGGHYSHWGTGPKSGVIFSTSDNSDPRTNGRKYEFVARPVLSSGLAATVTIALPVAILALHFLLAPNLSIAVSLALLALIAWAGLFFDQVLIVTDSFTYITWNALVPLGYPLFLAGIKGAFGSVGWAGVAQLAILVAACMSVAFSVGSIVKRRITTLAVLLLLLCDTPMFSNAGWILSEALFVSLVLLNIGAAFWLIAGRKIRHALMLALTAALIMFVRPAGYFAPLGLVFLVIAQPAGAGWLLKWAGVALAGFFIGTLLINFAVRGNGSPSQVGRVLFPHVAFLFDPQFVSGPNKENALVIQQTLKPHRDGYENASGRTARVAYLMHDYNPRLVAMDNALAAKCASDPSALTKTGACSFQDKEKLYADLFIATVYNRPLGYFRLISEQLWEAWKTMLFYDYGPVRGSYLYEAVNNYAERTEQIQLWKLPLDAQETRLNPELLEAFPGQFVEIFDVANRFIGAQRLLIYLTGIVTLIAIPVAIFFRRNSKHWLALGYCGVFIHGSMVLTAAVTVFIPRYALPVDPVILVAAVIMTDGLLCWGVAAMRRLAASRGLTGSQHWPRKSAL